MRRVLIDEDRFSVSLPGENVVTAGLSGMAFDSRFASVETAVGGVYWSRRNIYEGDGNDEPPEANIQFGHDFGHPPFFFLGYGNAGPFVGKSPNRKIESPTELELSHVSLFEYHAFANVTGVPKNIDPTNGAQVIAHRVTPTAALVSFFYYVREGYPGNAFDYYPIKWLALA